MNLLKNKKNDSNEDSKEDLNFKEATMIVQFDKGNSENYQNHKLYLKEMYNQKLIPNDVKLFGLSKSSESAYVGHLIVKTGSVEAMKKAYTASKDFEAEAEKIRNNLPGTIRADFSVMNFDPPGFSNDPKGFKIIMGQIEQGYYEVDENIN